MKNYLLFFAILIINNIYAQMNFNLSLNKGYFINHSENLQPVTGNDEFVFYDGLNLGLEYPLNDSKYIQVTGGKFITKIDFYQLKMSELSDGDKIKVGYLSEETYPVDIRYFTSVNKITGYGIGLTITGTNHIFSYDTFNDRIFKDIFNSTGIGVNGNVRLGRPVSQNYFIFTELLLRYMQAVAFEGKGRDFSNYDHNYFQVSLAIGFGSKY